MRMREWRTAGQAQGDSDYEEVSEEALASTQGVMKPGGQLGAV
jgi:hypothetical protein